MLAAGVAAAHPFFEKQTCPTETIAHRGGAALRPENTLVAFEHAHRLGAQVLELDLRVSADGAIVALHDATVDRTTEGRGRADAMTLEALRALDAGYRFSPDDGASFPFRGQGVRVPTLEEILARLPQARLNLEMKQFTSAQAALLCERLRAAGAGERVLVASIPDAPLAAFRRACPEVATSMSSGEAYIFIRVSSGVAVAPALQIPYRIGQQPLATPELLATARKHDLRVHIFTINDEPRMRSLIALGVDGIITDRPDLLLRLTSCGKSAKSGSGS